MTTLAIKWNNSVEALVIVFTYNPALKLTDYRKCLIRFRSVLTTPEEFRKQLNRGRSISDRGYITRPRVVRAEREPQYSQPRSQGLSSYRLGRARDPGWVWSRATLTIENTREGSSVISNLSR